MTFRPYLMENIAGVYFMMEPPWHESLWSLTSEMGLVSMILNHDVLHNESFFKIFFEQDMSKWHMNLISSGKEVTFEI